MSWKVSLFSFLWHIISWVVNEERFSMQVILEIGYGYSTTFKQAEIQDTTV